MFRYLIVCVTNPKQIMRVVHDIYTNKGSSPIARTPTDNSRALLGTLKPTAGASGNGTVKTTGTGGNSTLKTTATGGSGTVKTGTGFWVFLCRFLKTGFWFVLCRFSCRFSFFLK